MLPMITQPWCEEVIALRDRATKSPGFFRPPSPANESKRKYSEVARADRQVSARVFPNGEFGVGFVPPRGISAQDRRYERERRYAEENATIELDVQISPEGEVTHYGRKKVPGFPPPKLGIGAESSRVPKKYGMKGITAHGRKMVRNGGTVIDKAARAKFGHFPQMGTVTVPSYSPDTMKRICTHWGDIVRKFFQKLRRIYARHLRAFDYVSVTEIQPSRLVNRHEVGLHLHFLFVAFRTSTGEWILPDGVVRQKWQETLEIYLGAGDTSVPPNYRREGVTHSSAGYMAKYMSKGGNELRQVAEEFGEEWLPSQWWSMSTSVRRCIKALTIRSNGWQAEMLLSICSQGMTDYLRYVRCSTLQIYRSDHAVMHQCPEEIVLGYGGMLTHAGYQLFDSGNADQRISEYLLRTLDKPKRS